MLGQLRKSHLQSMKESRPQEVLSAPPKTESAQTEPVLHAWPLSCAAGPSGGVLPAARWRAESPLLKGDTKMKFGICGSARKGRDKALNSYP